jgi:hypothetical protein
MELGIINNKLSQATRVDGQLCIETSITERDFIWWSTQFPNQITNNSFELQSMLLLDSQKEER